MRFLRQFIPALVAGLLATTTLTTSVASACGGYIQVDPAPRVLAVSSHSVLKGERWTHRAFVVLEQSLQPAAEKLWALLAPGTYDATRIKLLSRLAQPVEVTLVGPSGARVVKTDKQVGLTGSFWSLTRT